MKTLRTVASIRRHLRAVRQTSAIALVPTMGALHDGHVALFRAAARDGAHVVASVFVNPTQFNDPADFAAYPRDETRDAAIAAGAGVSTMFAPSADEMYAAGNATTVDVHGPALGHEGTSRPGHFAGVATVCVKLFNIVQPRVAYFGQKDAQQVSVLRAVVKDLHIDLDVRVVPTVRDVDGLALSSRNARLSTDERRRAGAIPKALRTALLEDRRGGDAAAAARQALDGLEVEYVDVTSFDGERTLVVAVRAGNTRLIDNVPLERPELGGL
jgi:pantoate--beta-alanine ligase